jgi:hypothetical protein
MSFTPQAVVLPVRKNAFAYPSEQVKAVYDLLQEANPGQGIQIDEPQSSLTRSATRTGRMKAQLLAEFNMDVKAHNIERDGTHIPAVSKKKPKKGEAKANGNGATAETETPDAPQEGQTQVTDPDQQETPPENPEETPQETPQEDTTGKGDEDKSRRRRRNRN